MSLELLVQVVLDTTQVSDIRANFRHADGLKVKISQMRNFLQMLETSLVTRILYENALVFIRKTNPPQSVILIHFWISAKGRCGETESVSNCLQTNRGEYDQT